jgi:DNA-binding NarL/FixJ family response regulator
METCKLVCAGRKIRILIADDDANVREGIKAILKIEDDIEILGTASNGLEAVSLTALMEPDVILLDLDMPHLDGFEATKIIMEKKSHPAIVVLDVRPDLKRRRKALECGAITIVDKSIPNEDLIQTIRSAVVSIKK